MDNKYIEDLRKKVKTALKDDKMRFRHTIGVADTCACLAMRYDVDMEKAYIAGLLHDCAKCVPDDIKISICEKNGIEISDIEYSSPYLLHAKVGSLWASTEYGIVDKEICSAIMYHTTGKPAMTLLEKIVFIADYIEPYRNKASDLDQIRSLVFKDLDKAVFIVLRNTITYLERAGKPIDKTTISAFEYYVKLY